MNNLSNHEQNIIMLTTSLQKFVIYVFYTMECLKKSAVIQTITNCDEVLFFGSFSNNVSFHNCLCKTNV